MSAVVLIIDDESERKEQITNQLKRLGVKVVDKRIESLYNNSDKNSISANFFPKVLCVHYKAVHRLNKEIDMIRTIYNSYATQIMLYVPHDFEEPNFVDYKFNVDCVLEYPFKDEHLAVNIELLSRKADEIKWEKNNTNANKLESDSVFVPINYMHVKIDIDNILFAEADGSYTQIVLRNGKKHQVSQNLKSVHAHLSHSIFMRVSRSYLVNIKQINEIDHEVIKVGKHTIKVSKSKKKKLLKRFNILRSL